MGEWLNGSKCGHPPKTGELAGLHSVFYPASSHLVAGKMCNGNSLTVCQFGQSRPFHIFQSAFPFSVPHSEIPHSRTPARNTWLTIYGQFHN